ncbi:MAG: PAS domain S-box protein [Gammaproteobacteria bacterium]|nr:PAS domain S-box protein [Gammaproteobacteria bacterium]
MISHNHDHNVSKNQRILQQSLWYALICMVILITIITIHYNIYISSESTQRNNQQTLNLKLGKTTIVTELSNIQSDVNFLARQAELHGYFDNLNAKTLAIMAHDFQLFSDKKIIYDQIRLIGINGMEVIRINNQNGKSTIVDKENLQNKKSRYYFIESLLLNRNEIYISPFDLNIEHGKIQLPLKPVIRFGTPVFNSKGIKVGVLILNYLGNRLLNNFRTATSNISKNVMLLNHEGYWLSHHNRNLEWGFMLDLEQSFATDFNTEWKQISSSQSGQFETQNGLFSYSTIYPGLEITGLSKEYNSGQSNPKTYNQPWNLIALITPEELNSLPKAFIRNNLFFYLIIFALFLLGTHIIARLRVNQQITEIQVEFEQHFRKVLESIELNVLAVDLDGNISFCNDSLLNLLGWNRAQLIGKNWIETLVVNRYKNICSKIFQQSKDDNKCTTTHESWLQDRIGNEYLIRWHDTSMTDTEGNLIGLIFMGEDITQYRENEIKIRHLSEAVEQSPASVMLTDQYGKIEYINPKFEHLTGYKLDDIKGLNPSVLKSGEMSKEDYSQLWNKVKKGEIWRGILHNRKKNGELYWESASISGIKNPEGEITHFLAVKEDITEQKMLEERFKHCFNSAPVAMVMTDSNGEILLTNETLQNLYGYEEEDLVGQSISLVIPEKSEAKQLISQQLTTLVETDKSSGNRMDFLAHKKSGEIFPVEIGYSSAPTLEGKLNISAVIDLTARIELENKLLQRNDEISRNQALNTVGKMANMIAHDLRNPLSSIKMGLQIFQKQSNKISQEDAIELNQIALEQVLYMEEILEDLMSYSRPDAIKLEWIDIQKVVEHSIGLVQKDIDLFKAKINTWYEKGLPVINADSRKLRQVISNLLTNAMQSVESLQDVTPVINLTVQLDLTETSSYIKITIQDNGCGIDNDKVEDLFEPFYTSRAKGTGLGLAIARRFIELQHGTLQLQSAENDGTTATVKLNIDPAQ